MQVVEPCGLTNDRHTFLVDYATGGKTGGERPIQILNCRQLHADLGKRWKS